LVVRYHVVLVLWEHGCRRQRAIVTHVTDSDASHKFSTYTFLFCKKPTDLTSEGCSDLARIHFDFDRTAGTGSSSRNPLLGYGAQDPLEYCSDGHCWSGGRDAKVELHDLGCRCQLGREVVGVTISSTRTRTCISIRLDNTKLLQIPPIPRSSIRNAQNNT